MDNYPYSITFTPSYLELWLILVSKSKHVDIPDHFVVQAEDFGGGWGWGVGGWGCASVQYGHIPVLYNSSFYHVTVIQWVMPYIQ